MDFLPSSRGATLLLLVAGVTLAAPSAASGQPRGRDTLRLTLRLPASADGGADARALERGLTLAIEEGRHAASLLRRALHVDTVRVAGDGLPALILSDSVVLDASCVAPRAAMRFSLCPPAGDAGDSVVSWDPALERFGAGQLNARFVARWRAPMTEPAWRGWMLGKIAWESALRGPTEPRALVRWLHGPAARFDGHQGASLSFGADHNLRHPRHRVLHRDGRRILELIK